ncbi:MAG: hypothetical protein ACM3Q2_07360, partial [Syntrophothermus sp.]
LHNQLKPTRGAAVAIAEIIAHKNVVRFCSIGNISGSVINGPAVKNMISYNGIVGHETRRIHVAEYPWEKNSILLLISDGIISRWNLDNYPGLAGKRLPLIAAVFYRDFQRGNDDLSVILTSTQK